MSLFSFRTYTIITLLSVAIALANSYSIHKQFYPTIIHLSTNKVNRTIFINFILMAISALVIGFLSFTFGEIREIERLSVIERAKRKIIDIALLLVIFREEINMNFIILMIFLIAMSLIHWIAIKRSEYLIAESQMRMKLHSKLLFCFTLLTVIDFFICRYFYSITYSHQFQNEDSRFQNILFGFEFLLLALKMIFPFIKYSINLFEILTFSHFDTKQTLFSILEFFFTVTKLIIQLILINQVRIMYGLPLYLIADVIENIIGIYQAFKVFIYSCYLIYMIKKIDDVNEEDIDPNDKICLICLHDVKQGKKLACNHIFHTGCLRTWISGNPNQFCPKCKRPIKIEKKLHPTHSSQQIQPNKEFPNNNLHNEMHLLSSSVLNEELKEIQNTISFYQNIQIIRDLQDSRIFQSHSQGLGSVPFGLPQEAQYIQSLTSEIKRLQIKLMNRILMAVEKGEIDTNLADSIYVKYSNQEKIQKNREYLVKPEQRQDFQEAGSQSHNQKKEDHREKQINGSQQNKEGINIIIFIFSISEENDGAHLSKDEQDEFDKMNETQKVIYLATMKRLNSQQQSQLDEQSLNSS